LDDCVTQAVAKLKLGKSAGINIDTSRIKLEGVFF